MNKKGFVLILVMIVVCALTACVHTHTYEDRVVPPTCTEDGYTEYVCSSCGEKYRDNEVSAHHTLTTVAEKAATCTEAGNIAYYVCSLCNRYFSDESGQSEITDKTSVVLAARHTFSPVAEKSATCTEAGHIAYYECSVCNKYFSDKNGQNEIKDKTSVVTAVVPHNYSDGACSVCGKKYSTEGLEYTIMGNSGDHAYVSGIGTATDTEIVIAEEYEGKPVTGIYCNAFENCIDITSVTIPDSVTRIVWLAFSGCSSLTSITIPSTITFISYGVFGGCTALENVYYTGTIDEWVQTGFDTSSSNPLYYAKNLYINNQLVTEANLTTATAINKFAFYNYSGLMDVTIPFGVTSIGYGAFYGCSGLTSIAIPDSVKSVGEDAITGTAFYENEDNWENGVLYVSKHLIKAKDGIESDYSIKAGVRTISDAAFKNIVGLTSITIPDSVIRIGKSAFEGCKELATITILSIPRIGEWAFHRTAFYNNEDNWENGVLYIGKHLISAKADIGDEYNIKEDTLTIADSAFSSNRIKSVTIPDSVTIIGDYAFVVCGELKSVTIPDGVTSIGEFTFQGCENLLSVTIGKNVTSIGSNAFYGCNSLTNVTIPNGVTSISEAAFYGCNNLTSITIPDSVTSIGNNAFECDSSLTSVYYKGTADEWGKISIGLYNDELKNAKRYYYSETEPTTTGNYWHYDESGNVVVWEK